jgi:hypothetical protein
MVMNISCIILGLALIGGGMFMASRTRDRTNYKGYMGWVMLDTIATICLTFATALLGLLLVVLVLQ